MVKHKSCTLNGVTYRGHRYSVQLFSYKKSYGLCSIILIVGLIVKVNVIC